MLDGVAGSNSVSLVSLRCVIGPENLRHPLNQSGAKFGHLLSAPATLLSQWRLQIFTLIFDRLLYFL